MVKKSSNSIGLQLELLEERTLLAADITCSASNITCSASESDIMWLDAAVDTEALIQYELVWFPSDSQLVLNGDDNGSLVINVDYLPNNVKSIAASSFTDVTLTGTRGFDRLHAVDLDRLSVDVPVYKMLATENVNILEIFEPAPFTFLEGDSTFLEVEDLTNTFLYSDLEQLDLEIKNPESSLWVLSLNPNQTINTNFIPNRFNLIGLENPQLGIIGEELSGSDPVDAIFAELQLIETQNIDVSDGGNEFLKIMHINNLDNNIEITNDNDLEAWEHIGEIENPNTAETYANSVKQNEHLEFEENKMRDSSLWEYSVDSFYDSKAWLPEERIDDVIISDYGQYDDFITENDYSSFKYDSGITVQPESYDTKEMSTEQTWLEKVGLRLNKYLASNNNARLSLEEHILLRISKELTPGERPGLIVDPNTSTRNKFNGPSNI